VPAGRFVPCRLRTSSSLYPIFVDALNSRCVGAGITVGGSMRILTRRCRCGPLRFDAIDAVKHDSQHDRGAEREERNRCCSAESAWIQRSHVHPLAGALTQQFAFAKSVSAFSGLSRQKSGPRREAGASRVRYGRLGACDGGGVKPGTVRGAAGDVGCGGVASFDATRLGSCPTPKAKARTIGTQRRQSTPSSC
jgi:hypothetical protein